MSVVEEGGVKISPDLVVIREKVHYFFAEKVAIYFYRVKLKLESGAVKNLDQQVAEMVICHVLQRTRGELILR